MTGCSVGVEDLIPRDMGDVQRSIVVEHVRRQKEIEAVVTKIRQQSERHEQFVKVTQETLDSVLSAQRPRSPWAIAELKGERVPPEHSSDPNVRYAGAEGLLRFREELAVRLSEDRRLLEEIRALK